MRTKFPQPYRGQPRPKYPKPRRQIRNLSREKFSKYFQVGCSSLLTILSLATGLNYYFKRHDGEMLFYGVLFCILFLTITISIADVHESINKFRNGYDIDISSWKDQKEKTDEETDLQE